MLNKTLSKNESLESDLELLNDRIESRDIDIKRLKTELEDSEQNQEFFDEYKAYAESDFKNHSGEVAAFITNISSLKDSVEQIYNRISNSNEVKNLTATLDSLYEKANSISLERLNTDSLPQLSNVDNHNSTNEYHNQIREKAIEITRYEEKNAQLEIREQNLETREEKWEDERESIDNAILRLESKYEDTISELKDELSELINKKQELSSKLDQLESLIIVLHESDEDDNKIIEQLHEIIQ